MKKHLKSAFFFILFLLLGLFVFVVFSHIRPVFSEKIDKVGRICLIAIFLAASIISRKFKPIKKYSEVLFAYFIATTAMAIDLYLPSVKYLYKILGTSSATPFGIALDKLDSSIIIIVTIIVLTKISGASLASIYLVKGKIRESVKTGTIAFIIAAAVSIFVAKLFGAQDFSLEKFITWIPFILIFIIGNALNEELLFRGLFLRKIEPFISKNLTNLAISIPFVLHHTGITYTNDALMFLLFLLPLSLAWGYITQKTDSIWGSVIFHAGTDIPIILVIFSRMG